jgi:hypothetical protein
VVPHKRVALDQLHFVDAATQLAGADLGTFRVEHQRTRTTTIVGRTQSFAKIVGNFTMILYRPTNDW